MNALSRLSRIFTFFLLVSLPLSGTIASGATSPTSVLNQHSLPTAAGIVASTALNAQPTEGRATIDTGGLANTSTGKTTLARTSQNDTSQPAANVKALQKALVAAGYYWYKSDSGKKSCKIDGWFGPYTQLAVMEYQRDHGLSITGTVDQALYNQLTGATAAAQKRQGSKTAASTSTSSKNVVPAGFEKYLKSTSGTPANNAAIVAKAKSLAGKTPMETAQNIFNFVRKVKYQYYSNTKRGAVGTLSAMTGNCCDQAHLVVSLLRASGIPAQYGHSTDCTWRSGLRGGHVWAYAYINGSWQGLDTTSYRNSVGHLNSFRAIATPVKKTELSF